MTRGYMGTRGQFDAGDENPAPFWMDAKRDGLCAECEGDIRQGDRMVWDAEEFKAYCKVCGEDVIGEDLRRNK